MKKQRTPEMIMREIRNLLGELGSVIGNSPKGKILQGNTTQSLDPRHSGAVGGIKLSNCFEPSIRGLISLYI